jgi:hypothetical protein
VMLSAVMLNVAYHPIYAEQHFDECLYAECRGAVTSTLAYQRPRL